MSEIKDFINSKKFSYHLIKEDDYFDFIIEHDIKLDNQKLNDRYRDHVFVKDNETEEVIAYACLMKDYDFPRDGNEDVISMSTIYVNSEYRNQGISKPLIKLSLEHIKNENKIFMRTQPSNDGKKYSFDRISQIADDIGLPVIPHNLSFVYKALEEKKLLTNKSVKEKIELLDEVCNKLLNDFELKKDDLKKKDINDLEHKKVLNKILNQLYQNKNNKRLKI